MVVMVLNTMHVLVANGVNQKKFCWMFVRLVLKSIIFTFERWERETNAMLVCVGKVKIDKLNFFRIVSTVSFHFANQNILIFWWLCVWAMSYNMVAISVCCDATGLSATIHFTSSFISSLGFRLLSLASHKFHLILFVLLQRDAAHTPT